MLQWLVYNIFSKSIHTIQFLSSDTGPLLYIIIFRLVISQLVYLFDFSLVSSLSSGGVILLITWCFHCGLISLELYYLVQFHFFTLPLFVFLSLIFLSVNHYQPLGLKLFSLLSNSLLPLSQTSYSIPCSSLCLLYFLL